MRKLIATAALVAGIAVLALPAFAATPVQPNCLGGDVSGFAQNFVPWGQFITSGPLGNLTSGGFGFEILAHLQGQTPVSNCPKFGFPTPFPLP